MQKKIIDIGTGSGVIALMLAQRSDADSHVDAIELLGQDAKQAAENVAASAWSLKISVIHTALQDFWPATRYDLILCNPPYFSGSLLPPGESRSVARHDQALEQSELISAVERLLSPVGRFCVILPAAGGELFIQLSESRKLFLHRHTRFFSRTQKPQERSLFEFRFDFHKVDEDVLVLYESGGQWTEEYACLTHDFYLDRSSLNR